MKRLIIFLTAIFMICGCFADEYVISTFEGIDTEWYGEEEIRLKYDDEYNVYYLFRADYYDHYWYEMTPEQLVQLRATIAKAKEWRDIAVANHSDILKEIPNSQMLVSPTQNSGDDWYSSYSKMKLTFNFAASDADGDFNAVYITGSKVSAKQNKYHDIEWDSIVFVNEQIDEFLEAISEDVVTAAIQKHNASVKQNDDLFN